MGATGRIGAILRGVWPAGQGVWQARRALPGAVICDPLADPDALARAAQGCGAVLCLAGVTPGAVERTAKSAADFDANTALALAAVRAGAAAGVRVLLTSSAAVYGNRPGLLREDTPPAPVSDYGRAKVAMEREAARLGARLGVAVTSLRIGNIAGSDAILGGWRAGFALDVFADGTTPRRSYIGPLTLARVLAALAGAPRVPGVLNVAAPGAVAMGALLDAAGLDWTPRPAPEGAIPEVGLDTAALARLVPLDAGCALPETLVAEWHALTADTPDRTR